MYLHEDKEKFKELIEQISEETGKTVVVIEKDYYVTMILRLLSKEFVHRRRRKFAFQT